MLKEALKWKTVPFLHKPKNPRIIWHQENHSQMKSQETVTSGYTPQINQLCPRAAVPLMRCAMQTDPALFSLSV